MKITRITKENELLLKNNFKQHCFEDNSGCWFTKKINNNFYFYCEPDNERYYLMVIGEYDNKLKDELILKKFKKIKSFIKSTKTIKISL